MSLKFKAVCSYTDTLPHLQLFIIYKLICSEGFARQTTVVKHKRNQHSPAIPKNPWPCLDPSDLS